MTQDFLIKGLLARKNLQQTYVAKKINMTRSIFNRKLNNPSTDPFTAGQLMQIYKVADLTADEAKTLTEKYVKSLKNEPAKEEISQFIELLDSVTT